MVTALAASTRRRIAPPTLIEECFIWSKTAFDLSDGYLALTSAAMPETIGADIEVPRQVAYLAFGTELTMPSPGAINSTHSPRVENSAKLSAELLAPTAIKPGTSCSAAGKICVEFPVFPAAATITMPG